MSIECMEYRPHASGALQGFANFRIPKMGIELFGCGVFSKNGARFLGLPSREYQDPETGEKKYIQILRFIEKDHKDAFCKAALVALDDWCAKQGQPEAQQEAPPQDSDLPF